MIAASMIVSILLLQQPFWAAAAAFLCLPADKTFQCCSHLLLSSFAAVIFWLQPAAAFSCLQTQLYSAAAIYSQSSSYCGLQQQPFVSAAAAFMSLETHLQSAAAIMAHAAVNVGCSSSFKWLQHCGRSILWLLNQQKPLEGVASQEIIIAAAKWQKQLQFNNC